MDRLVALYRGSDVCYPDVPPFHPPELYPEFSRASLPSDVDARNHVYAAVRQSLRLLGLDSSNDGTRSWNPLRTIVRPGDHVLIKPNWVSHRHERNDSWQQLITHGSVIRPVIDYVQLALEGTGRISIADGPMLSSDFSAICQRSGVAQIKDYYDRLLNVAPLELLDLRSTLLDTRDAVIVRRHQLPGDPRGGVVVNLGRYSAFYRFRGEGRYYGADYDVEEVNRHHHGEVQEYQLSATAIRANVIIDIPKLKSHHKVGVTLALKGVVGLNSGRNWLPHRTQGTPRDGGDQFRSSGFREQAEALLVRAFEQGSLRFPRVVPKAFRVAKRVGQHIFGDSNSTVRGGGWHGNDTLWRMVHDINRALVYADSCGRLHTNVQRKRLAVVDGIVAGEGMGPTSADPRFCGVIVVGFSPVAVDVVGAELMGFDYSRIPQLARSFEPHSLPLASFVADDIVVASNVPSWDGGLAKLRTANPFAFAPPLGWNNYVERGTA